MVLLGLGIASIFILAFPSIIYIGIGLLVVPGILIWLTPPAFMYGSIAALSWIGLRGLPRPARLVGVASALTLLAVGPPLVINSLTEDVVREWTRADIPLARQYASGDVIAFVMPMSDEAGIGRAGSIDCEELCQRLLFNGAFRRVLVALSGEGPELDLSAAADVAAYRIERAANCAVPQTTESPGFVGGWGNSMADYESHRQVLSRIAAGDCLVREWAKLGDAELILAQRLVHRIERSQSPSRWSLAPIIFSVNRIELVEQAGDRRDAVFRLTQVASHRVDAPFIVGITDMHWPFAAGSGIRRSVEWVNRFDVGDQSRLIFGTAVRPVVHRIEDGAAERIMAGALADPALPFGDARFRLADRILKWIARKPEVTVEDVDLVQAIIRDRRFGTYSIPGPVFQALGRAAEPLIDDVVDRLFSTELPREREAVDRIAWTIFNMPPQALARSTARLEELTRMPGRRGVAYVAIARLADGGTAEAPFLGRLVEGYKQWSVSKPGDDERKTALGALMALCRLGQDGLSQKQVVVDLLEEAKRPGSTAGPLMHAAMPVLWRMGADNEVDRVLADRPDILAKAHERKAQLFTNEQSAFSNCRF